MADRSLRRRRSPKEAFNGTSPIQDVLKEDIPGKAHLAFLDLMVLQRAQDTAYLLAEAAEEELRRDAMVPRPALKRVFTISFIDPASRTKEVLLERAEAPLRREPGQSVDESLAKGSMLPVYLYVGAPLARRAYDPAMIDRILSERDYGTPKPFGSGAAAGPAPSKELRKREERLERDARGAVIEAIVRKEAIEKAVAEEVIVLSELVALLRKGEDIDRVIERLPPLSRLRFRLALRKKKITKALLTGMLLGEINFLKGMKKRLERLRPKDLVSIMKLALSLR